MHQTSDTNSAQKVCRILRVLSTPQPLRLADICDGAGLNKATTLRLLDTLMQEGFVQRDPVSKRYLLGDEALVLGVAMQGRDHIRDRARPALQLLAAGDLKAEKKTGLRVHGKTGQACPVCGDTIREVSFADSSLQYCATCQTGGKPLADRRLSRLLK